MTNQPKDVTRTSQDPVRQLSPDSPLAGVDGTTQPDSGEGWKAGSARPNGVPDDPVCSSVLSVEAMRIEVAIKVRGHLNPDVVESYAHAMRDGVAFPPVVVFRDGDTYCLADGAHRVAAAKEAGLDQLDAEVRAGTERDTLLYAVSANIAHGLRMTVADKKRVAALLLSDPEWGLWSSREIGRRRGLDGKTVERLRRESSAERPQMRKVTRQGTTYAMATRERNGRQVQEGHAAGPEGKVVDEPQNDHEAGAVAVADEPATSRTSRPGESAEQGGFSAVVVAPNPHCTGESPITGRAVAHYAGPEAVLWLWTTTGQLPQALASLERWGFVYADLLTWVKDVQGKGGVVTGEAEHFVVAVRGKVSIRLTCHALWVKGATQLDQLTPFYDLVEKACPGRKLVLFGSRHREGWTSLNYDSVPGSLRELPPPAAETDVEEGRVLGAEHND